MSTCSFCHEPLAPASCRILGLAPLPISNRTEESGHFVMHDPGCRHAAEEYFDVMARRLQRQPSSPPAARARS